MADVQTGYNWQSAYEGGLDPLGSGLIPLNGMDFFNSIGRADSMRSWLASEHDKSYNSAEAVKDRDFQLYFDSTATQRRLADIKAAGLNPWLALQNSGIGATGNAGSSAASSSSHSGKSGKNDLSNLAQSAAFIAMALAKLGAL